MNNLPPNHYTLEMIRQQRIDKKKEILQSKEQMLHLAHQLFAPPQSKNKFEGMMQHVNMGRQIARYLPHHRSENASKTHPKSSHDKFKTASKSLFKFIRKMPIG